MKEKVIIALDVSSRERALRIVGQLSDLAGMFKIGSQLYTAEGPALVREIIRLGGKVFLDLKFHDIPNTVTQAAIEAAKLGVSMLTIHACGGRTMMNAVSKELRENFSGAKPLLVAVTILTSLDTRDLFEIGLEQPIERQVERLALMAQDCGLDGVVCSPREIHILRRVLGSNFKIVVPGIRMPDQPVDDQQRTATPRQAIEAGADYIVIGRAVTGEPDARSALQRLLESI